MPFFKKKNKSNANGGKPIRNGINTTGLSNIRILLTDLMSISIAQKLSKKARK